MTRTVQYLFLTALTLLALSTVAQGADTQRVYFRPSVAAAGVGDTVSVSVALDSGLSLVHYYRVKMQFDTTVLQLDTIVPSRAWDSIALANSGQTFFYKDSLDPSAGEWYYDAFAAFFTQPPHIDGPNDLARVRFTALQSGVSEITFFAYRLENNVGLGQVIPCTATGGLIYVCPLPSGYQPGNVDGLGTGGGPVNISDLTYLVSFLFRNGPAPTPLYLNGDVNCNLAVNVSDLTYLVGYLFRNGPPPCDPCN